MLAFLRKWVARGYAGEMAYIPRSADRRAEVRAVVPGARSAIVTGTVYNTVPPYASAEVRPDIALISRYNVWRRLSRRAEEAARGAAGVDVRRIATAV